MRGCLRCTAVYTLEAQTGVSSRDQSRWVTLDYPFEGRNVGGGVGVGAASVLQTTSTMATSTFATHTLACFRIVAEPHAYRVFFIIPVSPHRHGGGQAGGALYWDEFTESKNRKTQ